MSKKNKMGLLKWVKALAVLELGILGVGIVWLLISRNSLASGLTGFIWMATIPFVLVNFLLISILVVGHKKDDNLMRILFIVHCAAILFLVANIVD